MDERLADLLNMALAERFDIANVAMRAESEADAEQIQRLIALNEKIEHHPGISEDAREVVQEFLHLDNESNDRFQQYLYLQGAKDCVAVLRELGVIK